MSEKFFDRQYRFIATVGGAGFEIGEPTPPHNSALHIAFSVERTDSQTLNTSKITLWNLNQAHINTLMRDNCTIEINAGYGNARPCVFRGTVTNVVTELEGADRATEIEAVDGFAQVQDTYVTLSYKGTVSVLMLVEAVASMLGLPVTYSSSAKARATKTKLASGYSYVGPAKTALEAICKVSALSWSIQNGILQITFRGDTVSTSVQVISADSGLIGIPKKIYNSAATSGEDTGSTLQDSLFGYEVVYFMNGNIGVNDLVKLESKLVTGIFRVYKLQIDGDNLEGDWQCTAQLIEVGSK